MVRSIKKISQKAGLAAETPVHVGERKVEQVKITVIDYDEKNYSLKEAAAVDECFLFRETPSLTWINIDGLHDISVVEKIGDCYGIHPLIVADILNTEQRPKMDVFDDYIFLVLKMHIFNGAFEDIEIEQISIIIGENYVLTFQERQGDIFDAVRNRLKTNKGRIRKAKSDYLAYALTDAIVDNYFKILEGVGEEVEDLEDELVNNPTPETMQKIHFLKREMILLRKSVWPLREIIGGLQREDSPLIKEATNIYLRDLYDHTIQVIDTVETFRDMISGMLDIYLSSVSNRMNEVMKVLTIFASIFIPLTFIAGLYGMNFEYMPELKWRWGYFAVLGVMSALGITLLIYFRRKKWL